MMFNFTPDEEQSVSVDVPFVEEARADFARYYGSRKNVSEAIGEIKDNLNRLGATLVSLMSGKFLVNGQERIGYVLKFRWQGVEGVIPIAGLPCKHELTDAKERQIRVQALLNIAAWLENCLMFQVLSPNSMPLIQFILVGDSGKRIIDHMVESGAVPMLSAPDDVVVGEFDAQ